MPTLTQAMETTPHGEPERVAPKTVWGVLVAALFIFAVQQWFYRSYYIDDAFITFRYARNWAQGFGLVYNPGGAPVEGYSNFLWLALLTLFGRFGIDIPVVAKILGLLLGAATIVVLPFIPLREFGKRPSLSHLIATPLLVASSGLFGVACAQGLETPLFVFLLFALCWAIPRELCGTIIPIFSPIAMVLLVLTRPEGIMFVIPIVLVEVVWLTRRRSQRRNALFLMLTTAGVSVAALLVHTIWRLAYYGFPFPNTFYAKVTKLSLGLVLEHLTGVISSFWGDMGGLLLLMLAVASVAVAGRFRYLCVLAVALLLTRMLYVAVVGEAFMGHWRFLLPCLLLAYLACELGAMEILRQNSAATRPICIVLVLFLAFSGYRTVGEVRGTLSDDFMTHTHIPIAMWLRQNAHPGSSLAFFDAGVVPYYAGMTVIDLGGLNEAALARIPGYRSGSPEAAKYVIEKRPTYIILRTKEAWPKYQFSSAFDPTTEALEGEPALRSDYRFTNQWQSSDGQVHYLLFQRRFTGVAAFKRAISLAPQMAAKHRQPPDANAPVWWCD